MLILPLSILPSSPNVLKLKLKQVRGIAALFTIARTQKQPRSPLTEKWIKKLWYIHTTEYYSAMTKNECESAAVRWMNLEPLHRVSQKEKKEYRLLTYIYGI